VDVGFCSQHISLELNRKYRAVDYHFLSEADVPSWGLTILGQQSPEVTVVLRKNFTKY
jgi:hypothetical protein